MAPAQGWRKSQGDGDGGDDLDDRERAEVTRSQLGELIVGGGEEDEVTNVEGMGTAVLVGVGGHASFSCLEMDLCGRDDPVHACDEGSGMLTGGGSERQRPGQAGVVAVVEVEGRVAGGGIDGVVVGKLEQGEVFGPVSEVGRDVGAEHLFDGLVGTLGLAVRLRMEGCGET